LPSVLFVSGEYPPDVGGVGDYTHQLRAALPFSTRILTRRDVKRWDARSLVRLLRTAPRPGIVHIQYQPAAFDLLGDVCVMPALLRLVRPRVRTVTTFHDVRVPYLFPRAGRLRWQAVRLLARGSHAVVAADGRDLQALGLAEAKGHLIPIGSNVPCAPPPGYERPSFRRAQGLDGLTLVYFGLLNASKGLESLFDAFDLVLRERPDARLLLLGGRIGASDPTDARTASAFGSRLLRLGPRVVQPGFLQPADLSAWLLAGDVALLPYADGASARRGSLLACAAHGLPIVSTAPAAAEVADAVHAVPAGDPAALAHAALQVAGDAVIAGRLRAGSAALAQRSTWSGIAARHVALYESLLYS
jgi:glycosyltransferase involved in cell wall biosynthesis